MSPIFPRVSTFSGVALFQPAPRQKRERSFFASQTERNSIIDFSPTNSPLPPLSIHPKPLDIYRSAKVLLGFLRPNWQFRLSGISGAPFYSTPEFRLSSSFRAAPLFKVGNTLPTFLLKSPPLPLVRRLTREETASDSPRYPTSCCILQSGHVAAAWNIARYSRKMKTFHASIISLHPQLGRGCVR